MLKRFIDRPVLSTVISIIIVVLGIIGLVTLPVEQYPDIAPPTISVHAIYSGANAEAVQNSVVIPLEEQINGVEGMSYMTSSASNGSANINVFFKKGIDPDVAAVKVQNLVAQATPLLPQEVVQIGVSVQKRQSSNILMLSITTDNTDYDGKFVQNYANINILPQIKRVQGVGDAMVYGARDYSMRIWFKPDVMASYKISPMEVLSALRDQNIEAAPGELGLNGNQTFQYTLRYTGKLQTAEEFANIIIRSVNGQVLRVRDVAEVELGSLFYAVNSVMNGKESVVISISQTAGSNAQDVINNIKVELDKARKTLPPGVEIHYLMDANEFLSESISKVITTLLEAFVLVFLVVFIFLQDFRSTLIPAISIPVAIIGTFFFLQLFGFSINLLTLFALVLAIGIVVDDAIVVVEAVHAQLDAGEKDPRIATINAMKEIAPAIVSITLVMAAVFIPVSFIGGTAGIFYKQFGLTLAIAIGLSAVNALTLSPALCALFLKPHTEEEKKNRKGFLKRFFYNFDLMFNAGTRKYKSALQFLGKKGHRWITIAIIIFSSLLMGGLMKLTPRDFVPQEDGGVIMGMAKLAPGTSLERTDSLLAEVSKIAQGIKHMKYVTSISGVDFMTGINSSSGGVFIKMDAWGDRPDYTLNQAVTELKEKTDHIKDANIFFMGMPTLQGFGMGSGVSLELQDKTGGDINKFFYTTTQFVEKLRAQKEDVLMVLFNFDNRYPQKEIEANIAKIKDAGITLNDVMMTMQAYIGSMYVSNFNVYGKQFRVMVQAAPEHRAKMENLNSIFVRTASGEMAPITEFITLHDKTGPMSLSRFNLYSSMSITIIPNPMNGKGPGDIINLIDKMSKTDLPKEYGYEFSGAAREQAESSDQTLLIFALSLIFIYLLLAGLYESYILPLAVILSLPVGLAGVFIFVDVALLKGILTGGTMIMNNIYVQISLVMLIGLLAKNAILIVEYAIQRRQQGMSIVEAAVNGAVARLRPILMTSFAFIFGLLPLAMSTGAGAVGNKSIGISAIGGMLVGTIIGILIIPSLYIIFQSIQEKFTKSGFVNTKNTQ